MESQLQALYVYNIVQMKVRRRIPGELARLYPNFTQHIYHQ